MVLIFFDKFRSLFPLYGISAAITLLRKFVFFVLQKEKDVSIISKRKIRLGA